MHAAIWSQPIAHGKLGRSQARAEAPHSLAGKIVLGVGIALTLLGGLLVVFGLTGFFVRGGNKFQLGSGAPAGAASLLAGLVATRSVGRWERAKSYTTAFSFLGIVASGAAGTMAVMAIMVLAKKPKLLLTTVIAVAEASLGCIVALLAFGGSAVSIFARPVLINPSFSSRDNVCINDMTANATTTSQSSSKYEPSSTPTDITCHEGTARHHTRM